MTDNLQGRFYELKSVLKTGDALYLSEVLSHILPSDIAEIYDLFDRDDRIALIECLSAKSAAELIIELDLAERDQAIHNMDDAKLSQLVENMEPDDATDILGILSEDRRAGILAVTTPEQSDKIRELLTYEEDTAGGIMTKNMVVLPIEGTVRQAIDRIRSFPSNDSIHYIYLINGNNRFTGVIPLRQLVLNDKDVSLDSICIRDIITVKVSDDQEEVIHIMSKYDLPAVAVIDDQGCLVGRITHDDIMDAFEQEAYEDMFHLAGLDTAEFRKTSIVRAASIRLSWLMPALAGMSITAAVMLFSQGWFEDLAVYALLVIFVPMIAAIGGNCGIQIATVIVRGLATGDLAESHFRIALKREGRIALIMAPVCGVAAWAISRFGLSVLQKLNPSLPRKISGQTVFDGATHIDRIAFSVGIGMTSALLVAAALGLVLPFLFRRMGTDPAIASGPVVTTVNDIISVIIFLAFASFILAW